MQRSAWNLIELLIVLAIVAVIGVIAIPQYRSYLIRNDLNLAAEKVIHMLNRAQILSQAGEQSAVWGVNVPEGIVFLGESYDSRDPDHDEDYPLKPTIAVSGLIEVTFSRIYGEPSETGVIILTAINGDTREIEVGAILSGSGMIDLAGNASFYVVFEDIRNQGNGAAEAALFVGPDGVRYEDGEEVPLKTGGTFHTDAGLVVGATGLAVERADGYFKIMAYGDLVSGGKEIVDARIELVGAVIDHVDNDIGEFVTENPFDGNVSNGVGGDEVTLIDNKTVLFQTRTTNYGDSILIYWKQEEPRWLR